MFPLLHSYPTESMAEMRLNLGLLILHSVLIDTSVKESGGKRLQKQRISGDVSGLTYFPGTLY